MNEIEIWLGIFFLVVIYVVVNILLDAKNPNLREHIRAVKFNDTDNKPDNNDGFKAEAYSPKRDRDQVLKGNIVDDFD